MYVFVQNFKVSVIGNLALPRFQFTLSPSKPSLHLGHPIGSHSAFILPMERRCLLLKHKRQAIGNLASTEKQK